MSDLKETVRKAVEGGVDPSGFTHDLKRAWDEVQADARLEAQEPEVETAPPAIDVSKLLTVDEVEREMDRNVQESGSEEEFDALLGRRTEIYRNQPTKPEQPTDTVVAANESFDSINARIEVLQAEVASLGPGDGFNKRTEIKELQEHANQIGLRLPYVGINSEELSKQERAAAIRHEELKREAKNWKDSPAKEASLNEQAEEAIRESVLMRMELRTREGLRQSREARADLRERQAVENATAQWQEAWDNEIAKIERFYPSPFVALGNPETRPERWQLDRAKAERAKPPRESLVQWHRDRLESEAKDAGISKLYPAANLVVEGE